jgi:molybdopterin-guanine dinucleotide biosynthesis protein
LRESPVVALLGPRQSGKTTLANQVLTERKVSGSIWTDRHRGEVGGRAATDEVDAHRQG